MNLTEVIISRLPKEKKEPEYKLDYFANRNKDDTLKDWLNEKEISGYNSALFDCKKSLPKLSEEKLYRFLVDRIGEDTYTIEPMKSLAKTIINNVERIVE